MTDLFLGQEHTRATFSVLEEGISPEQTSYLQPELGMGKKKEPISRLLKNVFGLEPV